MPPSIAQVAARARTLTIRDLGAAGFDRPGELVRGRFIPTTPTGHRHAEVESNLTFALKSFLKGRHLGKVLSGEVGIITQRSPDTVRGADVAYVSYERLTDASAEGYLNIAPELVGEVVSPNDRWTGINEKLEEYFAIGVLVVWVVDPRERRVYAYRSPTQLEKLGLEDVLVVDDVLPGLRITVSEIFAD